MRLKHLESALSSVDREFPNPNVTLEQYPTSPHLTAAVVHMALENGDVGPGRTVLDLGCGTGMLCLGCAVVETDHVIGVDCDAGALEQAASNIADLELEDGVSLIQAKVSVPLQTTSKSPSNRKSKGKKQIPRASSAVASVSDNFGQFPLQSRCVDTVLTNPPFGTKPDKAGIDLQFLKLACTLAKRSVYSFHKSSTRDYVLKTTRKLPNVCDVAVVAEMKFDIPKMYKFHKEKSLDVAVDLIRVELAPKSG